MSFYRALRWTHRWVGLIVSLPLLIVALTGAILVYDQPIDRMLHPSLSYVTPCDKAQPWSKILKSIGKAYPKARVGGIFMPAGRDIAARISLNSKLDVYVNPYTAAILGDRPQGERTFIGMIHRMHVNLLIQPYRIGVWIVEISSIILLLLGVTGIILWWRTKIVLLRKRRSWRRFNYDLHSAMGLYLSIVWFILGLTGAVMFFWDISAKAVYAVAGGAPIQQPDVDSVAPFPNAPPISVDEALALAEAALPGAKVTSLFVSWHPRGVFTANMRFAGETSADGNSRVKLDRYTGKVLWKQDARTLPLSNRILAANRPAHTGEIWGWAGKIIACAGCILLAVQIFSGFFIWWRPRRSSRGTAREQPLGAVPIKTTPGPSPRSIEGAFSKCR